MTTRKFIEAPHGNPWRAVALAGLAVWALGCENTNGDTPDGGVGGAGSGGAITGGTGGAVAGGSGGGIVGGSNGGSGGAIPGGSGGAITGGSGGAITGGSGGAIAGGSGGAIAGGSGGAIAGGSGGAIAGGAGGTGVGGAEPPPPAFCGGFGGIPCERGFDCVDDPNDDCDPANGGADCGGICVPNGCPDADADGICDGADGECNSDGSFLMCRRVAPPCAAGTVPEVRNGCYTDACLTWEQCGGAVVEPPVACAPVLPGEFGDCDAVLGVGVGLDGTCQVVSGCGCDAACDGRVFATLDECEAACVVAPPPCGREPSLSPRDPMYDRYEGTGFRNACRADADCFTGGCSGEVCSATADVATTCELVPPAPGACGCVAGECQWYVDVCAPPICRSDADNDGICDDVDGECNLDGMQSVCDRIPPACRAGTVPAVLNGCYTGECLGWDACAPAPPPVAQACGGFAGLPCPRGQACVDVPNDGCDPANGGADCPGMCAAPL